MTKESIIKNLKRLISFYENDDYLSGIKFIETPSGLLDTYSRILDVNGAPRSGLSILYLFGNDFSEMKTWAEKEAEDFKFFDSNRVGFILPQYFSFSYSGYYWVVYQK